MKKIFNIIVMLCLLTPIVGVAQTTYYTSTAREKSKIKQDFPYDIALKTMDKKITHTDTVFKTNGKPLVVMFWLTTCFPCRMELQAVKEKYPTWKKETDFELIALSYDFPGKEEAIYQRVKEEQWPFPVYWDFNKEFGSVLPGELNGLPQVFVFDKDGKLVYQKRKYTPGDEDTLYAKVKELAKM
jgi:thiol-disulfide isomerase/thioredoxin